MDATVIALFGGIVVVGNGLLLFLSRVIGTRNGNGSKADVVKVCAALERLADKVDHHDEHARDAKAILLKLSDTQRMMVEELRATQTWWKSHAEWCERRNGGTR